ncbi:MAG TPA: ABC transporter permease [Candidatus Cybelea sp.]|nr:ABC transporter permease [Candidatus Cybelea sp.]
MNTLRGWIARLIGPLDRSRQDHELDAEIESHLELHTEDNLRRGMSRAEARRLALVKLGGIEQTKERYREQRGLPLIETIPADVRFGLRVLRRTPGVTMVAIATLALAIGVNTAVYSIANGLLVRKPPVDDPDRLQVISGVDPAKDAFAADRSGVSALDFLDWAAQATSFSAMAAIDSGDFTISGGTTPQQVLGCRVSPNYFQVIGVSPALGRAFASDEAQHGHDQVVVLGNELWQERFGGDPHVLGRKIRVNGNRSTVIGVMPARFRLLGQFQAEMWAPLVFSPDELRPSARSVRSLHVLARLKPGIDERQAAAEMQSIAQRIAQTHKATDDGWGASVMSLHRFYVADSNAQTAILFLMGAVGFLLLIACTNLANLLLARNSARQREFSVRRALGAGRVRLARQLLTECLLLSAVGGALGVPLAFAAVGGLRSQFNWNEYAVGLSKEVVVDGHVLIFTALVSIATAMLFGLVPAVQMTHRDANEGLKDGDRGATAGVRRSRVQRLLIIGQFALSLFLLVGTGLFVELFIHEVRSSTGFDSHNLLTASVSLRGLEYLDPGGQKRFFEAVERRLTGLADAQSIALASSLPFDFPDSVGFTIEGHPVTKPDEESQSGFFVVSTGFFSTTHIPILRGRSFTVSDSADSASVVIVNQGFAKRFFGDENPIGQHLRLDLGDKPPSPWSEIVGISANIKEFVGQQEPRPELYASFAAHPRGTMNLIVRARANPINFANSLRRAVWAVDADQAVTNLRTMDRVIADSLQGDNLMSEMMGAFALLALLMAGSGIFGVLSYLVGQRTHEMGIRLALGATPNEILRLVIRNGMALVGLGIGLGLLFSLVLPKLVAASFGGSMSFVRGWALLVAPGLLALVGLAACYVPAIKAMRVDPMVALRYE